VKQGTSAIVNPELPAADAGAVGLAGVYVYTMDGARESNFTIRPADVLPINPAPPVAPINNAAIAKTLAKLRSGQPVNIAFHGDSITAGAEVKIVNGDRSLTYTGRVMAELRRRFPNAPITETFAAMGGISAEFNGDIFKNKVLAPHDAGKKVDLVLIALGMNDPAKPIDNMKRPLTEMIRQAKARGMEVLLVTTMPFSPATERKYTGTPKAQIAQATREVGAAENVAVADVYAEWMNLPTRGIPAHVPVHNWATHPGEFGMRVYSDVILRHFVP
jgi:lysophospholipase L1-like esterase